ncbi:MAG: hypothetical protein H0V27_10510 [Pyrinomonadaceae bacterium]|jgi:hypothetical protein|nr:hypothetical protein [Pyrinomonadaceae bacterium]
MANRVQQDAVNGFVNDLRATHGDNLASVVLYGSSAVGNDIELQPDYNLLIALQRITPEDLRLSQAPVREWQRLGHPLPIYFTVEELRDAADVFPIEFHNMERARLVLHGVDPFAQLKFSDVNLRHQTEYELRSKLIQLRRLYIPASTSIEKLCDLMMGSLTTFAGLFAPVLMLHNRKPPRAKSDCVRETIRLLKLDAEPFERIFALRATDTQPSSVVEANELFTIYLAQVERVIEAVDEMPGQV